MCEFHTIPLKIYNFNSMKERIILISASILILLSFHCVAQWEEAHIDAAVTLPPVALIDIEPEDNNIYFSVLPAEAPGMPAQVIRSEDKSLVINYTSALPATNTSRSIVAGLSGGCLPAGIELIVEASEYSGQGKGRFGIPAGKVSLSDNPMAIITDVGNCFTGNGEDNGHLLNLSVKISDFSKLNSANEITVSVIYTICDN